MYANLLHPFWIQGPPPLAIPNVVMTFSFITLSQEFGNHDNVIKLLNVIRADNDKDIYLVFEYMGKCKQTDSRFSGSSATLIMILKVLHN